MFDAGHELVSDSSPPKWISAFYPDTSSSGVSNGQGIPRPSGPFSLLPQFYHYMYRHALVSIIQQHWWFSGKIGRCHSRSTISVDSASPGFDSRPMHGYVHSFLARLLLLLNPRMSDVPALVYSAAYEEIAKDEALLGCETKESCAVKFC